MKMPDHAVPKPDWKDNAIILAKVVGSVVPVAGGPIVEILNFIDGRCLLGKRMRQFLEDLNKDMAILQEKGKGPSPEELAENEAFVSTFLHVVQAATRSHQKEKINALRNAVLNSALPSAPDADMQLIFINLLDSMTASHIKLLLFLADARNHFKGQIEDREGLRGTPLYPYIEKAFPEMDRSFYILIINQLKERGLTDVNVDMRAEKLFKNHTTKLGWDLVQFVKSPIEDGHEGTQER